MTDSFDIIHYLVANDEIVYILYVDNKYVIVKKNVFNEMKIIKNICLVNHKYYAYDGFDVYEIGRIERTYKTSPYTRPSTIISSKVVIYDDGPKKTGYYSCRNNLLWITPTSIIGIKRNDIADAATYGDNIYLKCYDGKYYHITYPSTSDFISEIVGGLTHNDLKQFKINLIKPCINLDTEFIF